MVTSSPEHENTTTTKYAFLHQQQQLLLLLQIQPSYGSMDCVQDYLGEPVPER